MNEGVEQQAVEGRGPFASTLGLHDPAHELGQHFPDGHLYVDLHAPECDDRTPALLARFLRALGVPATSVPDGAQERAELYRSRLAGKRVLVVLDGVRDEAQVWPLLPGLKSVAITTGTPASISRRAGA